MPFIYSCAMEKYQELRERAFKNLQTADHMLTMTYPLVQDQKLLIAVLDNIFLALTNAMGAILHYERLNKNIPPFQDNFDSKFNMFRQRCVPKFNIGSDNILFIQEIKELMLEHKRSPVEFARKDSFVICSAGYNLRSINTQKLKEYIKKTKEILETAQSIVV